MYHYRKTRKSYRALNASDTTKPVCTLCDEDNKPRIIRETTTMILLPNRVSYDIFEGMRVVEHLMIVPKRHVEHIEDFTNQEKMDFMSLAGEFEMKGFNVYARGAKSATRSVAHQHTHLIKTDNKKAKSVVYIAKPHILIRT
ncbi:MAG: HIT domain-containing protein [Candidatus Saccharibacteria bacterium]|nr:MAG: HIT domain-containing protein [Candidatus Saccharibacteria bacterium]